jgi:hypothetical protein
MAQAAPSSRGVRSSSAIWTARERRAPRLSDGDDSEHRHRDDGDDGEQAALRSSRAPGS